MRLYSKFFAWHYHHLIDKRESESLRVRRAQLLAELKGEVLEIGSGTGINFPLYTADVNLLALEPSPFMLAFAQKKRKGPSINARIELLQSAVEDPILVEKKPTAGWDAIVCTLVLCTIPQPKLMISRFKDWLRPGGRLLILEHIRAGSGSTRKLQNLVNPVWKLCSEGCNLNRPTDLYLKAAGFRVLREEYFWNVVPFYQAILEKND